MGYLLPMNLVDQTKEIAASTISKEDFCLAQRQYVNAFMDSVDVHAKLIVFQMIALFLELTPYDWARHQKFLSAVREKLDEFERTLCRTDPEAVRVIWKMSDQINSRTPDRRCIAVTTCGVRCARLIAGSTTVFGRCCTQHGKLAREKFAFAVLSLSKALCPDLGWTIARVIIDMSIRRDKGI